MKTTFYATLPLLLFLPTLASCQDKSKMQFSVKVADDKGKAIPECSVKSRVFSKHVSGEAFGRDEYDDSIVKTNKEGIAYFNINSKSNLLSYSVETPEGYYKNYGESYSFNASRMGVWQPKDVEFEIRLKKIKNPIAMYAKKGPDSLIKSGKKMGYDLVVGDWVMPEGKGKTSDIVFRIDVDQKNDYEFTSILTLFFPNEGDGLVPFEAPIHAHGSQFRSDYTAPNTGYQKNLTHTRERKPKQSEKNTRKKTMNYYIRVRSELDEKGNVIKAHYGKVYGDFMNFTHYLNPTPNDRNVEFDPKKNLIDTGYRGHKVQKP